MYLPLWWSLIVNINSNNWYLKTRFVHQVKVNIHLPLSAVSKGPFCVKWSNNRAGNVSDYLTLSYFMNSLIHVFPWKIWPNKQMTVSLHTGFSKYRQPIQIRSRRSWLGSGFWVPGFLGLSRHVCVYVCLIAPNCCKCYLCYQPILIHSDFNTVRYL